MTLAPAICVVTGGAGFIGSHISERLLRDGHTLRIVDNYLTGSPANIAHLRAHERLSMHEIDIADADALTAVCNGADYLIHQAALPSVPRSVARPLESWRHCATGTLNVLEAARRSSVRRVVYASSSSVYGDAPGDSKHEGLPPHPLSPYAAAKLAGEALCQAYSACYELETVSLRYFNVFGPRQDPGSAYAAVIPRLLTLMLDDQRPPVTGDGLQSRDFTYVDNVVEGNLLALAAPQADGQVFNLGADGSASILELVATLNELLGTELPPLHIAERPGDVRHSRADISRARAILGYAPTVDFRTGLERTVAWFSGQPAAD